MASVTLGNTAPIAKLTIPETGERVIVPQTHIEKSTTTINLPPHIEFDEALHLVSNAFWPHMSSEPPAWVESDDELLQAVLAQKFGCPAGQPDDWEITFTDADPPLLGPPMDAARMALEAGVGFIEPPPGAPEAAPEAAPEPVEDSVPAPASWDDTAKEG